MTDLPSLAVLVSSGTGFPKGFYDRFARHLARRGAIVLTYDYRGFTMTEKYRSKNKGGTSL